MGIEEDEDKESEEEIEEVRKRVPPPQAWHARAVAISLYSPNALIRHSSAVHDKHIFLHHTHRSI